MRIFIDTEFVHNDFVDMDLVSIGLVTETGLDFYAERDDFDVGMASPWVRSNVLPLLRGKDVRVMSRDGVRDAVSFWLKQFEHDKPGICYDNVVDQAMLWDLLDKQTPPWVKSANIRDRLDWNKRKQFFEQTRLPEHHALYDAHAN